MQASGLSEPANPGEQNLRNICYQEITMKYPGISNNVININIMKKFIFMILAGFVSVTFLKASNNPVQRETSSGKFIEVTLLSEGQLSLFSSVAEVLPPAVPQEPMESYTKIVTVFYVTKGENELIEINCSNYKKVFRAQMSDKPELTSNIGRRGYKFSDMRKIIDIYNRQ